MGDQPRILVVDDDKDSCELIAMLLGQAGYVVETAADGFEALAVVAARRPDLLLTDLRMPGMDGVELIRRVHAVDSTSERELPAVLTTGVETRDQCTAPVAYGAVACLTKPMNLDDLLWAIDCALALAQASDAA
jgi:CheY-like chemotaxis protein